MDKKEMLVVNKMVINTDFGQKTNMKANMNIEENA